MTEEIEFKQFDKCKQEADELFKDDPDRSKKICCMECIGPYQIDGTKFVDAEHVRLPVFEDGINPPDALPHQQQIDVEYPPKATFEEKIRIWFR